MEKLHRLLIYSSYCFSWRKSSCLQWFLAGDILERKFKFWSIFIFGSINGGSFDEMSFFTSWLFPSSNNDLIMWVIEDGWPSDSFMILDVFGGWEFAGKLFAVSDDSGVLTAFFDDGVFPSATSSWWDLTAFHVKYLIYLNQ